MFIRLQELESTDLKYVKLIFSLNSIYCFTNNNDVIIYWVDGNNKSLAMFSLIKNKLIFTNSAASRLYHYLSTDDKNILINHIQNIFNIEIKEVN